MHERERIVANTCRLISGMNILNIPVIWTEQNPDRLGPTLDEIRSAMPEGASPIGKMSFSCCGAGVVVEELKRHGRTDVLVAGIETHICVLQTAMDLLGHGYRVQAVADCMSSRTPDNNAIGLERMRSMGAQITSLETALFELVRTAAAPVFKEISKLIK
jgi:nicotinamidase-related amidase